MSAPSLRAALLRRLLPPLAALLALGTIAAYQFAIEPATEAYDHSLINAGIALGERIRLQDGRLEVDLPSEAEQILRTDRYDTVFYGVRGPKGELLGGDPDLPSPPAKARSAGNVIIYDAAFGGQSVRAVALRVPCGGEVCTVKVAETTVKRDRLVREILLSTVLPQFVLAVVLLGLVWHGVKRGLEPLTRLSEEIGARSPRDLRPIDESARPIETQSIVTELNKLFARVDDANLNQQRFIANAAHQLRTPLAVLRTHAELALREDTGPAARTALEQIHRATVRATHLANQLLTLARAERSGQAESAATPIELPELAGEVANEWVHRALARNIDLGFELEPSRVVGHPLLLREALVNLIANAIEYSPEHSHVTTRCGNDRGRPFIEVEDDGPGIPVEERPRVTERFYRINGSSGPGAGLGLAIVREIALAHGGDVLITEGAHGRGCRVRIELPGDANAAKAFLGS